MLMRQSARARLLATTMILMPFAGTPAFAQDAAAETPADTQVQSEQTIVVTGSRIARLELESVSPVAVIGSVDLERDAAANIQDTLLELPQIVAGLSRSNSNFLTNGNGVATIDMRNLGPSRTLTLVNGRRFIAGTAGTSAVDVNNIPTEFVQSVQIVTGGASAVYGSDAISGVVNFVLKDSFDGIQVRAQTNITQKGDNPRYLLSATAGTTFGADDRGSIMVNFTYDRDEGLYSRKRTLSAEDCAFLVCGPASYSTFAPQGRFNFMDATGANTGGLFTFERNNSVVQGFPNGFGYNRNGVRFISVPVERYLTTAIGHFDLGSDAKLFAEVTYGKVKSNASLEAFALANTDVYDQSDANNLGIPITNPFIPASIAAAIAARNADADPTNDVAALAFRRRQNEVFDRSNRSSRDTWRVATGVEGTFGNEYHYELSFVYGRLHDKTASEDVNIARYRNALDAIRLPDGSFACRSVAARGEGCVPINIFGYDTASAAASAYVANGADRTTDIVNEQQVVTASVSGKPFALTGAGNIGFALGFEHRREKSAADFDILTNTGQNSSNLTADLTGKFHVSEVFGELSVPLIADTAGFRYFGLIGAARYSEYSTVGGVFSWNAGAEWEPFDGLRLRGLYAIANRAPNVSELFSAPGETFAGVNDPCDGVTATSAQGGFGAACRAIPGIANAIAANGVFRYTLADQQGINGFIGGNPNLSEEKARTLTLGAVFSPSWLRGFNATVDYYKIDIKNGIGTVGRDTSIEQCLLTGNAAFCDSVVRNANTGLVTTVNATAVNVAAQRTEGIDFSARYGTRLGFFGDGKLDFSINYTYVINALFQPDPSAPLEDFAGTVGFSKHRATARLGYNVDNFSISWQTTYFSKARALNDFVNPDPAVVALNFVESRMYHDVQLRWDVGEQRRLGFYVGADNVFDRKPPYLPGTPFNTPTGTETAAGVYDAMGRRFYAGATVHF